MSEAKINMSLDQIIQKNKGSNNRGRGGQRGFRGNRGTSRGNNRGALRGSNRGSLRGNNRGGRGMRKLSNQNIPRGLDSNRNYTNIRGRGRLNAQRRPRFGSERRIIENNGPRNIRNNQTIFEKVGRLKRCGIHWDNLGNSKGTADVEYYRSEDAQKAINDYNNASINEDEMKVSYARNATTKDTIVRGTRRILGRGRGRKN